MKMTIGTFLFTRLKQIAIDYVFGVPGDFNLQLLEQVKEVDGIEFVGACNELNASYAADGYARMNGISALLTTYGVGDLSAVCGIAGACAEHVPIVFISGVPPLYAMKSRLRVHHSLAEGNFDNIINCLKEFTVVETRLTPANAVEEIDHALIACWREKRPVYIQVPSNISYLEVDVPDTRLSLKIPASDPERLESAATRIAERLKNATYPALLMDVEADRSNLVPCFETLVNKRQIPYAAFRTGKGLLSEIDPLFKGVYTGESSGPEVTAMVEKSDCLIAIAPSFLESSPMFFPGGVPVEAQVYFREFDVTVGGEVYEGVTSAELIERITELVDPVSVTAPKEVSAVVSESAPATTNPITHLYLWPRMARFFKSGDVIIAENGTSNVALSSVRLPEKTTYISQLIWGSIGYSLPALLGSMIAAPDRRHILFIGDGSIQLTVQELSTILNRGLKPIIFLLNNRGYTIERYILGMKEKYNDVANWRYTELPRIFAPEVNTYTASVTNESELDTILSLVDQQDQACFIEINLDPEDAPEALKIFGPVTAELDYGPRGPQRQGEA